MISDALFDAVKRVDHYLNNPIFDHTYEGELRERVIKLRNEMEAMVVELDTPPSDGSQ